MTSQTRVSMLLVAMATMAFVGARRADLEASCCGNNPPQCTFASACYDNGSCINCLNMCVVDGNNCNIVDCDRC